MQNRRRPNNDALMHLASAYHEDILSGGIGDKSRLPLAGRYATFDNVDDIILSDVLIGTETVTSVKGTVDIGNIIITSGQIAVYDTGKIWDLVLSNGAHYTFCEGGGLDLIDVSGNHFHARLSNIDEAIFWHTDGVQGEGSDIPNKKGFSTITQTQGTGQYNSTFSKDYSTTGLTISFFAKFNNNQSGVVGSQSGLIACRNNGVKMQYLFGGYNYSTQSIDDNGLPTYSWAHHLITVSPEKSIDVYINGNYRQTYNRPDANLNLGNLSLYVRSGTTQRHNGASSQIAYFEGHFNASEALELFEMANKNKIEDHSRFEDCDLYIKGGEFGVATDYSGNNISFTLQGTGGIEGNSIFPLYNESDYCVYRVYEGKVHYPIKLKEHCLTSSGVSMTIEFVNLSGVTIVSSQGTSTPTINGNSVELTAGSIYNLVLSDGTHLSLTEGYSVIPIDPLDHVVYDISGNGNHGYIANADPDCWDYYQEEYAINYKGWNIISTGKVPASRSNPHLDVLGNQLSDFTNAGKYIHTALDFKFNPYDDPTIYNATYGDIDSNIVSKSSDIVNQYPLILGTELTVNKISNIQFRQRSFNPLDIISTLEFWFDPSDGVTYDESNIVSSIQLKGKRPLVLDSLPPAIITEFPTFQPNGFNGMPCISFDGTQAITGNSNGAYPFESGYLEQGWAAFVVKNNGINGSEYPFELQSRIRLQLARVGSTKIQFDGTGEQALFPADTSHHIIILSWVKNVETYFLNNSLVPNPFTFSRVPEAGWDNGFTLGSSVSGGAPTSGLMSDVMIGKGLLPLGWAKGLMEYLSTKNGILLS